MHFATNYLRLQNLCKLGSKSNAKVFNSKFDSCECHEECNLTFDRKI